jgi:cytochrome c biogenesis protein
MDQAAEFLASVKLALFLLLVLALAAVAGTIIPQNLMPEEYIHGYGPRLYTFFAYLDLTNMYQSWWFRLLLGFLVINLVFCSAKRLPASMKLARPVDPRRVTVEFLKKQAFSQTMDLPGSPDEVRERALQAFQKVFTRPKDHKTGWGTLLYADRGAFSRFGAYLVHISLLLLIAGGVIGGLFGYTGQVQIHEGESVNQVVSFRPSGVVSLPFALRLDKFNVHFYSDGTPSEYQSLITVLENGREAAKADVRVNHPLTYGGVTFYQSSYGQTPGGAVGLAAKKAGDPTARELKLVPDQPVVLPDGSGSVMLLDLADNMMNSGPAARILIRPSTGGQAFTDWAFEKRPGFLPGPKGDWTFELKDYQKQYWTGLQASRDPGTPLIYLGCLLMLVGFLVAFFFSHQKLYIGLTAKGKKTQILVAGSAHRNAGGFQIKFERLAEDIRRVMAGDKS